MVRMDNLSAAIITSRGFPEALAAFIEFIQRRFSSLQGGWRNGSDSHGEINRNGVATSIGIRWRNKSESGGDLRRNTQIVIFSE